MENFLQIAIVGVLLSGAIQVIKAKIGTSTLGTKILTVLLSLIVGGGVYFLQDTSYWETVLGVLASASTMYAFILKK